MTSSATNDPNLPQALVESVLTRLGFADMPPSDLAGLNGLYAAYCAGVPSDNILKRIWLAGDRKAPMPGGDPNEFFRNWLAHGTGGTCFPINGGLCALLQAAGFAARRIAGSVDNGGDDLDGNHGSVLVRLGDLDYLADGQIASFRPLPLVPGDRTSTGNGIHDIRAEPADGKFDIYFFPGPRRDRPFLFRTELRYDPVDHRFFLENYALSASSRRLRSRFNDVLFICRRTPDSIRVVGGMNKTTVAADNNITRTRIADDARARTLIEEFGISEEAAHAVPPDNDKGFSMT